MTRWEFCEVSSGCIVVGVPRRPNFELIFYTETGLKEIPIDDPYAAMARLGIEGWELVSHAVVWYQECEGRPIPEKEVYTFKRPFLSDDTTD